jgi:hypothetical protein
MSSSMRTIRIASAAIAICGGMIPNPAVAAPLACNATGYCLDTCPGDLGQFCHSAGCSATGATCTWSECRRVNGNWGMADISCGDET